MSDFLTQFDAGNYQPEDATAEGKVPATAPEQSTPQNTQHRIARAEHSIQKDESYHKRTLVRYAVVAGLVLVVSIAAFLIFRLSNQVIVKNFVGTSIDEAQTWGLSNRITLEATTKFNLEHDEGIITSQAKRAHSSLQKGSVLKLVVSKGPDPDEPIALPDFATISTAEVRAWKEDSKALNANVNEIFSTTVEKNHFVKREFTDSTVTDESYTRKDGLLIYMSKGKEVFEKNITVPDFKDKSKGEVESWAQENGIKVRYAQTISDTVLVDSVIKQSIASGKKIAKGDKMSVVLSLGKAILVPNFTTISMDEAAEISSLQVTIQKRYSTRISYGSVISQSEPAGKKLIGEMPQVTVKYSLGRPYLDNKIGESQGILPEYFHAFTSHGANISYSIKQVSSREPKGTIVAMSKYAQFLSLKEHIKISVSKGNLPALKPEGE